MERDTPPTPKALGQILLEEWNAYLADEHMKKNQALQSSGRS